MHCADLLRVHCPLWEALGEILLIPTGMSLQSPLVMLFRVDSGCFALVYSNLCFISNNYHSFTFNTRSFLNLQVEISLAFILYDVKYLSHSWEALKHNLKNNLHESQNKNNMKRRRKRIIRMHYICKF